MDVFGLNLASLGIPEHTAQNVGDDIAPLRRAVERKLPLGDDPGIEARETLEMSLRTFLGRPHLRLELVSFKDYCGNVATCFSTASRNAVAQGLWETISDTPFTTPAMPENDLIADHIIERTTACTYLHGEQLYDYLNRFSSFDLRPTEKDGFPTPLNNLLFCNEMLGSIVYRLVRLHLRGRAGAHARMLAGRAVITFLATHPCLGMSHPRRGKKQTIVFVSR